MRVRFAALLIAFSVTVTSVMVSRGLQAQDDRGKTAYDRNCASCHGSDARGSMGPSLIPLRPTDTDLLALVRAGGSQMIALSGRDISDDDVRAVGRFLRTLGGDANQAPSATAT